ncbi:MAG: hypothetical protein M5U09_07725 [Gammaproteobacteria bacterium]|nr:hypothetical protein [Gammaproteobacteria bacterium]
MYFSTAFSISVTRWRLAALVAAGFGGLAAGAGDAAGAADAIFAAGAMDAVFVAGGLGDGASTKFHLIDRIGAARSRPRARSNLVWAAATFSAPPAEPLR